MRNVLPQQQLPRISHFLPLPGRPHYRKNPRIARVFFLNFGMRNFGPVLYADPKNFRPEFTVLVSVSGIGRCYHYHQVSARFGVSGVGGISPRDLEVQVCNSGHCNHLARITTATILLL